MTTIIPRPALDPADWQLSHLAIHQPTDLLERLAQQPVPPPPTQP